MRLRSPFPLSLFEWSNPDKRGDLLAVQFAELGDEGSKRHRQHRADAWDGLKKVVCLPPCGCFTDERLQVLVDIVDLFGQELDEGVNLRMHQWWSGLLAFDLHRP